MAGRVLVAVKRAADYNARIRVKPDKVSAAAVATTAGQRHRPPPPPGDGGEASILLRLPPRLQTGVDLSNVKMSMNPFCEVWLCGPPSDVQCTVANSWKSSHRSAMQNALPALCCSSHTNRSGAGSHQQRDRGAGCLTALARVSSRL